MSLLTAMLFVFALLVYSIFLGRTLARSSHLETPLRTSLKSAAAGIFVSTILLVVMFVLPTRLHLLGNLALLLQAPGLLLCNGIGLGFHSEGRELRLFYVVMAVSNAIVYALVAFAISLRRAARRR